MNELRMNGFESLTMDEMMAVDGGGLAYEVAAATLVYSSLFFASGPVGIALGVGGMILWAYDAKQRLG